MKVNMKNVLVYVENRVYADIFKIYLYFGTKRIFNVPAS